jgi:uncharacterized phage-associated protein
MAAVSVNQVADFFLAQVDSDSGDVITHLKLQKLLYYAQGWHLAIRNQPLFSAKIEAWAHGPVCPLIWERFKRFSFEPIPKSEIKMDSDSLNASVRKLLMDVWRVYGQFTAPKLEEMTHQEKPWSDARGNLSPYERSSAEISKDSMKQFFRKLAHEQKS